MKRVGVEEGRSKFWRGARRGRFPIEPWGLGDRQQGDLGAGRLGGKMWAPIVANCRSCLAIEVEIVGPPVFPGEWQGRARLKPNSDASTTGMSSGGVQSCATSSGNVCVTQLEVFNSAEEATTSFQQNSWVTFMPIVPPGDQYFQVWEDTELAEVLPRHRDFARNLLWYPYGKRFDNPALLSTGVETESSNQDQLKRC